MSKASERSPRARRAPWLWLCALSMGAVFGLALPHTASAQHGVVTIRFGASPHRDGYAEATVQARYEFLACPDPYVHLAMVLDPASLATSAHYWYKGRLYHLDAVPLASSVANPSLNYPSVQAYVYRSGEVVRRVDRRAGAGFGLVCSGDTNKIEPFPPGLKDRTAYLQAFTLGEPTPGIDNLRNTEIEHVIEKHLADQERQRREAEAAAKKAELEKEAAEKAAAEKAAREEQEKAQREEEERKAAAAAATGDVAAGGPGVGAVGSVAAGEAGLEASASSSSASNATSSSEATNVGPVETQAERYERLQREARAQHEAEQQRSLQQQMEAYQARQQRVDAIASQVGDAVTAFGSAMAADMAARAEAANREWEYRRVLEQERKARVAERWAEAKRSPRYKGMCEPSMAHVAGTLSVGENLTGYHAFTDCQYPAAYHATPIDHLRLNVSEAQEVLLDVSGQIQHVELHAPSGELIVAERMQIPGEPWRIRMPMLPGPHLLIVIGVADVEQEYRVSASVAPKASPPTCVRGTCMPRWLAEGPEIGVSLSGLYGETLVDAQPRIRGDAKVPFQPFQPHWLVSLQLAKHRPAGSGGVRLGVAHSTLSASTSDDYLLRLSSRLTGGEINRTLVRFGAYYAGHVYSAEFAGLHLTTYVEAAFYFQGLLFGGRGIDHKGEESRQRMRFAMATPALGVGANLALLDGLQIGFYVGGALNIVSEGRLRGWGGSSLEDATDIRPDLFMSTELRTTLSYKFGNGYRTPLSRE